VELFFVDPRLPALFGLATAFLLGTAAAMIGLQAATWGALKRATSAAPRTVALCGGAAAALCVVAIGQALDLNGIAWVGTLLIALLAALVFGIYLPGLEARRHAARRNRLSLQVIDLCGYLLDALRGPYGDVAILREYVRRPRRNVRDMQHLIAGVLTEQQRAGRGNVLDQLQQAASESGSQPLIDLTTTLRQVLRHDRAQVIGALAQQREQVINIAIATAKRRAQTLEFVILGVTAGALFFGLLAFILYVMTGGGSLLRLF
jgi:hypothetical protein